MSTETANHEMGSLYSAWETEIVVGLGARTVPFDGSSSSQFLDKIIIRTNSAIRVSDSGIISIPKRKPAAKTRVQESAATSNLPIEQQVVRVDALLRKIKALSDSGRTDEGIDEVIEIFESRLEREDWGACTETLKRADPSRMDVAVSLALLSMTFVVRGLLAAARSGFYKRLRRHLLATRSPDDVTQLLHGLA